MALSGLGVVCGPALSARYKSKLMGVVQMRREMARKGVGRRF
jgi:hypothetical protein